SERALVGEGGGPEWVVDPRTGRMVRVSGPQIMDLGPSAYVIPTEDKYKGRAAALVAMLAHDIGLQGYKSGRKPWKVPARFNYPTVDEGNLHDDVNHASDALHKREGTAHDLHKKVEAAQEALHKANQSTGKGKGKRVAEATKKLRDLQAQYKTANN